MNLNLNLLPVSVSFVVFACERNSFVCITGKWSRALYYMPTQMCRSDSEIAELILFMAESAGRGRVVQIRFQINYAWQKSPVKPWKCTNVDIISNVCDELLFIFWLLVVIVLSLSRFFPFSLCLCFAFFLSSKMVSRQRQMHYDYWL